MNRTNYQRELDALIKTLAERPRLLLHSCCAPCSSYVLEYLAPYFRLELFYYNPNIAPEQEYQKRLWEQKKLAERLQIPVLEEAYRPQDFYDMARGMEDAPEGGIRCKACYPAPAPKDRSAGTGTGGGLFLHHVIHQSLKGRSGHQCHRPGGGGAGRRALVAL